jgi:plastocyanin
MEQFMKTMQYAFLTLSVVSTSVALNIAYKKRPPRSVTPVSINLPTPNQPAAQTGVVVKIDNFNFSPKELNVAAGTVVTWQNNDDVPHTASSTDNPQAFDSGALDTDDKFTFTFSKPGKYAYFCKVHPHMTGVVIVK